MVHDCFLERVEFNCTPGARGWGKVLESTKERTKEKVKEKEKEKESASTTTKGEEKEEEEEKEKAEAEDTAKAGRRGYSTKGKCKGYYSYNSGTNVCHYCQKPGHYEANCRLKQRDMQMGGQPFSQSLQEILRLFVDIVLNQNLRSMDYLASLGVFKPPCRGRATTACTLSGT